jgi:hypothetical protein
MNTTLDNDGNLDVKSVEVGGVKMVEIRDKAGRVWSVPADDDNVSADEFAFRNILGIPEPEPGFYYQYVRDDQLNEYLSGGFKLVDPTSVGLPPPGVTQTSANAAIGVSPVSHHKVGNLNLVMCPEVLAKRALKAKKLRADAAKVDITIPRHLGRPVEKSEVEYRSKNSQAVMGQPIVTPSHFKEYSTDGEEESSLKKKE